MENARPQYSETSAPDQRDYTPGTLPKRKNTVTASVLANLLESNTMTGMESVFKQSTTRLGAVICYLSQKYNWHIDRRDIATGTADGRVAEITAYWLPQATIAAAFEGGARQWVNSVKAARALRRNDAEKCRNIATIKNAAHKIDPRQSGFWDGASC